MPDRWEELPLPESPRLSLRVAVWLLPHILGLAETALFENELVAFTQNGGWHRIDKLLPLVYLTKNYLLRSHWKHWIGDLRQHTDSLKVSRLAFLGFSNLATDRFLARSGSKA